MQFFLFLETELKKYCLDPEPEPKPNQNFSYVGTATATTLVQIQFFPNQITKS